MFLVAACSMAIGGQPFSSIASNQKKCPCMRLPRFRSSGADTQLLLSQGSTFTSGGHKQPSLASNNGAPDLIKLRALMSVDRQSVHSISETFSLIHCSWLSDCGKITAP